MNNYIFLKNIEKLILWWSILHIFFIFNFYIAEIQFRIRNSQIACTNPVWYVVFYWWVLPMLIKLYLRCQPSLTCCITLVCSANVDQSVLMLPTQFDMLYYIGEFCQCWSNCTYAANLVWYVVLHWWVLPMLINL